MEQQRGAVKSLEKLLSVVWREIAQWKDTEKRAITAQVKVDSAAFSHLDKVFVFADCFRMIQCQCLVV